MKGFKKGDELSWEEERAFSRALAEKRKDGESTPPGISRTAATSEPPKSKGKSKGAKE